MNRWFRHVLAATGALLTLAAAPWAQAQPTWNFDVTGTDPQCIPGSNVDNLGSLSCGARPGISQLDIKALSTTGSGGKFADAKVTATLDTGLGVRAATEPEGSVPEGLAVDSLTNTDLLVMGFQASVVLNNIAITKVGNNGTDVSILAWTGFGSVKIDKLDDAKNDVKDKTPGQLISTGWTLVGSFAAGTAPSGTNFNPTGVASSYWLISAYNSSYGTPSSVTNPDVDVFRVFEVSGKYAPEPGSLALVAAAMAGAFGLRRRGAAPARLQPSAA